jgi:hypothetical protein
MGATPTPSTSIPAEIVKSTQSNIEALRDRANAIVVKTPQDYIAVCNLVIEGRGFIKKWKQVFEATIQSAKAHLDTVKNELQGHVIEAEEVVRIAETKAEAYRAEEKRQRDAEQKRLNDEAARAAQVKAEQDKREAEKAAAEKKRTTIAEVNQLLAAGRIGKREAAKRLKEAGAEEEAAIQSAAAVAEEQKAAPPPQIKVAPSIPKVAGIKGRTNWKFKITDETKIPRLYCTPDEVAIGNMVRATKDKAKAEALIPGIEVWSEESV